MAPPTPRVIVSSVRAFARGHAIFRPGPVLVAVSGGTDSVALALILAELREEFGLVLHVAHFDHRTRPRSSASDAAFVAELADCIGAPIRVGRAERAPKSEDDARRDRYAFLRRAASEIGAGAIATGHTQDDQAETVLLHLARGSGLAGVAAMRPLRDGIARPLLGIGRAETRVICAAAKIRPREDPSNASLRFARNRVRRRVLPELERINPQVRAALARFADAAAEVETRIGAGSVGVPDTRGDAEAAGQVGAPVGSAARTEPGVPILDVRGLPAEQGSRGRVLAAGWLAATGVTLTARQRAALLGLADSTAGTRRIDLPGGQAVREYASLVFAAPGTGPAVTPAPAPLARDAALDWHGWRITLGMPSDGLPFRGAVNAATAARLVVRARRPGDRVVAHGKLQDLFVDAKVPARLRDVWPLVTLDDVVIWAPGLTPGPRSGRISIEAGPVGESATTGEYGQGSSRPARQVASKAERRPRGGNREHA